MKKIIFLMFFLTLIITEMKGEMWESTTMSCENNAGTWREQDLEVTVAGLSTINYYGYCKLDLENSVSASAIVDIYYLNPGLCRTDIFHLSCYQNECDQNGFIAKERSGTLNLPIFVQGKIHIAARTYIGHQCGRGEAQAIVSVNW